MKLKVLEDSFTICKIRDIKDIPKAKYTFTAVTDEEISILCPKENIPSEYTDIDTDWRGFRIEGILDFSLTGILSELSAVLAQNKIGIFAVSTYNTDYIFVKEHNLKRAMEVLKKAGYEF